jgi:hypothetical protein
MKYFSNLFSVISLSLIIALAGCSGAALNEFQNNDAPHSYELFSLLDDYPSLKEPFSNLDQTEFNSRMAAPVNRDVDLSKVALGLTADLFGDPAHPITDSLAALRGMLERIINQDNLDVDGLTSYADPEPSTGYAAGFYSFQDLLADADLGIGGDVVNMVRKNVSYIADTYDSTALEDVMTDLIAFLRDNTGTSVGSVLELLGETGGKLFFQANEQMWLNGSTLRTDRSTINTGSDTATGLGNAVRGTDALFSALNELLRDANVRNDVFDIIRESMKLTASTEAGKPAKQILRELICNLEDRFTLGGAVMGDDPDSDNVFYQDTANNYVNSELGNLLAEVYPALASLAIKNGKPGSITHDTADDSPIDVLAKALARLKDMGIDYSDPEYDLGQSMRDMVLRDGNGNLRSSSGVNLSALEHTIFTMTASNFVGYKDSQWTGAGWTPTAADGADNFNHGHGLPTGGVLTVNDCLFSQTGSETCGIGTYAYLSESSPGGDNVFRSRFKFKSGDSGNYKFFMYSSYPSNHLLSGQSVGDSAIPNGGTGTNPSSTSDPNYHYTTFWPYDSAGIGELNTGRWTLGWIARTCWMGEGPYYATDSTETITLNFTDVQKWQWNTGTRAYEWTSVALTEYPNGSYNVYRRPNGKIYAYVYKPDSTASNWRYLYPVDGQNDGVQGTAPGTALEDGAIRFSTDGGSTWQFLQRSNRYRATWNSDYYMVNRGSYYSPTSSGSDIDANCYTFTESVPERSANRECATQEEAMFKNFQWLINEKVIAYVMPVRINTTMMGCAVWAVAYVRMEANGIAGIGKMRRYNSTFSNNGRWLSGATTETSSVPADARIKTEYRAGDAPMGMMSAETIWESLGDGHVLPDIIGANFGPVQRMAFLIPSTLSSSQVDANWSSRSRLFPVLVALIGSMRERTYYVKPASGYTFNNSANNRYPLKVLTDGLICSLGKPMWYYQKNVNPYPRNTWKPYVATTSVSFLRPDNDDPGVRTDLEYQPRTNVLNGSALPANQQIRSLLGVLSENSYRASDGLMMLMNNNKMINSLLSLLQKVGSDTYADPITYDAADYRTWGARRKMGYALEQILTTIRTPKATSIERGYVYNGYPSWMFNSSMRPEDVDLNDIITEFIGSDSNGKGLAVVPDTRPNYPADWENFDRLMDGAAALTGHSGASPGPYDITETLISVIDKFLTGVTASEEQTRSLRHTLGVVLAYNNYLDPETSSLHYPDKPAGWNYGDELRAILVNELPEILEVNAGHNEEFLTFIDYFLEPGGFVEYLVDHMNSSYSFAEIIPELYQFLGDDIISQPGSQLWSDLADLLLDLCIVMGNEEPDWFSEYFQNNNADFNRSGQAYPDPYGAMGELLSRHY